MIVDIIGLIITGLIIGGIARLLVPGRDPMGCAGTMLLGIGGSLAGGFLGRAIFGRPGGLILAVICAVLILLVFRRTRTP